MDSKINYTAVGLFIVVLSVCLVVLFLWLSSFRHEKTYYNYLVYVKEDVTGLAEQSPVRFNGVPVGYVKSISIDSRNSQLVRILLKIESGVPITKSTVASLQLLGVTGVLYVGLKSESNNAPLLKRTQNRPYPIIRWRPSLLMQLSQVLPNITKNVQKMSDSMQNLFSSQNTSNIHDTLKNLSDFSGMLAKNSQALGSSIQSLQKTMVQISSASVKMPELMSNLNSSLSSINTAAHNLTKVTSSFNNLAIQGNRAVSSFSNQVIPPAEQSMQKFSQFMTNLNIISDQLVRNPAMLIRGKVADAPGPGEN